VQGEAVGGEDEPLRALHRGEGVLRRVRLLHVRSGLRELDAVRSPLYVYGFAQAGPKDVSQKDLAQISGYDDSRKDTSNPALQATGSFNTSKMRDLSGNALDGSSLPSNTLVTKDHFLAGAAGDIDTDPRVQLDVWTIDEQKNLTVVENDCTQ